MTLAIFAAALAVLAAEPGAAAPPVTREVVPYKDLKAADARINGRASRSSRTHEAGARGEAVKSEAAKSESAHGESAKGDAGAAGASGTETGEAATARAAPDRPVLTRPSASPLRSRTAVSHASRRTPPRLRPAFALGAASDVRPPGGRP